MQEDMHYYATLAIALSAGINKDDAEIIAYSSQYVDDSTEANSEQHEDGGLLYGIATAHHPIDCVKNSIVNRFGKIKKEEQRKVWVPFHFVPGGEGGNFEEKLICKKDSKIAQEMFNNHINVAVDKEFGLELIGIAAHAFMDTFSHYGFSGISSKYNFIEGKPEIEVHKEEIGQYVWKKFDKFMGKYVKGQKVEPFLESLASEPILTRLASELGEEIFGFALGHAGVATFPDRPYLKWSFKYDVNRPGNGRVSKRINYNDYIEALRKLHYYLASFAKKYYADEVTIKSFDDIESEVMTILKFEGKKKDRIERWMKSGLLKDYEEYNSKNWEDAKNSFSWRKTSSEGINLPVYRFHQAAAYHRYYMLKDLLPKYGIAVY